MSENIEKCFDRLFGFLEDVNPQEIESQIESGTLEQWCNAWRGSARIELSLLKGFVEDES